MNLKINCLLRALLMVIATVTFGQNVEVDVNMNIKHSVGGVSDFGRDRHITVHAAITEPDWVGEEEKLNYLINDLDVYFGRDNGQATFHFNYTPEDPNRSNHPDLDSMELIGEFYKGLYDTLPRAQQYLSKTTEMICGTNPHPTYPTLSWYDNGITQKGWQPKNVETSAEWVTQYLDKYFAKTQGEGGQILPKYWEVINEPDMLMMTGQFMVTSQEKLWEYHNLVADGVRARLGNKAPLIGGMTWGQHDFYRPDGLGRYNVGYLDEYLSPEDIAIHHAMSETQYADSRQNPWYQWDVMWKGFIDNAGANMDFYAVHVYDWPLWETNGGAIRSGGHTEAMLDMMEWYDVNKFGTRKPIVISEYGAVSNYIDMPGLDPDRRDWENLKPFSQMMMQFLERPDYIIKSMPFTPIKAEWGDYRNGAGEVTNRYPYTMMDQDANGDWQWSQFIKWYELWADVDGTRVDTKSSDLDIQVDAYIDGNTTYLILNNLETTDRTLDLNFFGDDGNNLQDVRIKHLFLNGNTPTLTDNTVSTAPGTVTLGAEATMILAYNYASDVQINETSKEYKYYGESLSGSNGSTPHRVTVGNGSLTAQVNGVAVPAKGEAMLRICGSYFWTHISQQDDRNVITVNGNPLEFNSDWRGEDPARNIFFGVLEVPIPLAYLSANNVIECNLINVNTYTNVSIQVWDMSVTPGRSNPGQVEIVPVAGVSVSPGSLMIDNGQTSTIVASVSPVNATNKAVVWSSDNTSVATVNSNGVVTAVSPGSAQITVTTTDGGFTAIAMITVNAAAPVSATGVSVSPSSRTISVGQSSQLTATVLPSNASNKNVTWSSSNSSVATVSSNGTVNAISQGSASITVTTVDGSFTASSAVTVPAVGSALVIQAEDFVNTGGAFQGFQVYTVGSITATNFNQTGDWADYNVNITQAGLYQLEAFLGTSVAGAAIEVYVDGVSVVKNNVVNNGNWDSFQSLVVNQDLELITGNHVIRLQGAGTHGWEWNADYFTLTRVGDLPGNTIPVTGINVSPANLTLTGAASTGVLSASVSPANASNTMVNWSSGNIAVATVSNSGVVTAISAGSTAITATSVGGGFSASSNVTVVIVNNNPVSLTIQAEDFSATGGAFGGFQIYTVNGVTATNFNQTGDWVEYTVEIPQSGDYQVEYFMGTAVTGAAVELILDGVSQRTDQVPNNGNWDAFVSLNAGNSINLSAGTHTIRLLGAGTHGWEWNMDRFVLSHPGGASREGSDQNDFVIYPNPATTTISIQGLKAEHYSAKVFDVAGNLLISDNIDTDDQPEISVKSLEGGVYILILENENSRNAVNLYIK